MPESLKVFLIILSVCAPVIIDRIIKTRKMYLKDKEPKCTCNGFYSHNEDTNQITGSKLSCKIHK